MIDPGYGRTAQASVLRDGRCLMNQPGLMTHAVPAVLIECPLELSGIDTLLDQETRTMVEENTVFWLGGRPRTVEPADRLADSEQFVEAIRAACTEVGCEVQRFISALGPYGTWLVEIQRDGQDQRVLWNGKEERLVLQKRLNQGGWEDPLSISVASQDADGFVAGVRAILAQSAEVDA